MPELPEVETIRRGLTQCIQGKKLERTEILCEKSFIGTPVAGEVAGRVTNLRRYGKALIIDLDTGDSLMVHLRMTGQLIFDPDEKNIKTSGALDPDPQNNKPRPELVVARFAAGHPSENFVANLPNKQTRVILRFENGTLYFNDQRKFGFIKVLKTSEVGDDPFIKKLAPEPWQMTPENFYRKLRKHQNSSIKAALLDQTIVAGLGNIYTDEALFMSRIHPEEKAGALTRQQAARLLEMACRVMELSIDSGGSTMKDYVKADGTRGDYLDKFAQVFNKTGELCPACGKAKIIKTKVAGRGTHICPNCQKLHPLDISSKVEAKATQKKQEGDHA
ncbi:bifunctional DNA-formamidopyrimidine glycosylase/DNA-(apurinic or apyrimidinic site) lyase [Candidatus Saccharibacteria bacterium]|nr:bifunctional DNA-formamidopyrimidine glycosylase/DNA-(apurinic or apyrimidinic site) lyase [Candidatus Saccharibacteria bacterium]